jgi:hypothetical protein
MDDAKKIAWFCKKNCIVLQNVGQGGMRWERAGHGRAF